MRTGSGGLRSWSENCIGLFRSSRRVALMGYRSLQECVHDLKRTGQLSVIDQEVDPRLEAAAIQRRVYQAGGPALISTGQGNGFPLGVQRVRDNRPGPVPLPRHSGCGSAPGRAQGRPGPLGAQALALSGPAADALASAAQAGSPRADLEHQTTIDRLPAIQSWPADGGPFITLPQVYTEDPDRPGLAQSNLGMYRVQLSGNQYEPNREVGLHYQIHRGIGVHHAAAIRRGEPLRVNVFVGGPPALAVAAVMPLARGSARAGFRRGARRPAGRRGHPRRRPAMPAEADFVITGTVDPDHA